MTRIELRRSMELAGQNLIRMLSPDEGYLPNFWIFVDRNYESDIRFNAPGHNLGRWWDAMLRLEAATGYRIPEDLEADMHRNLERFFDNEDHLCLRPLDMERVEGELLDFHSLREGLLALTGLIEHRSDAWAREEAQRMLASVQRLLLPPESWTQNPGMVWDVEVSHRYEEAGRPPVQGPWALSAIVSQGRFLEALVEYHRVTGDPVALEMATPIARFHLRETTLPDGSYHARWDATEDPTVMRGHTHSYLGVLRGLLLWGELTGEQEYIDAVAATTRKTVPRIVKRSGYTCHDLGQDAGNKGEVSSPGDAAQIALWLAVRHGYAEFFDDVERIVRARIIPSQIVQSPPLSVRNGDGSELPLADRIIGAFGGLHQAPHSAKQSVTDVTAAVLHTLTDIYQHVAVRDEHGITVHLHFDYEDEAVVVTSVRTDRATVTVSAKVAEPVAIRVPRWASRDAVRIVVNDQSVSPTWAGDYVLVDREHMPGRIQLTYDLPVRRETEVTDAVEYTFTWRGDEVVGIEPYDEFYPFYPPGDDGGTSDASIPMGEPIDMRAEPFDLRNVRLLDGPFKEAMERNTLYLHSLDPDRLLHTFRVTAGLPSAARPLGGWESPNFIIRGAFMGHYLTACMLTYLASGDVELIRRVEIIVNELDRCQQAIGTGYLAAFPEEYFDDIEAGEPGRTGISKVSWYVVHKIMDGLYNASLYGQNEQALEVLRRMVAWAGWRAGRLSEEHWQEILNIEHGGMKELLLKLYSVTGDPDHLRLAARFEHRRVFDPLAENDDGIITGRHGNSTIPKILGAARRYELLGEARYRGISECFWRGIVDARSYVTGGSTDGEHWPPRHELAHHLSNRTHENCTTHNMLKLTRHLFSWTAAAKYADYYERALWNGILPTQNPDDGMIMWYVPMASGYYKWFSLPDGDAGPDRKDSFWCCVGTGIESFAKAGDSIYFRDGDSLYVNLFIASEVRWAEKGLVVRQETSFPDSDETRLIVSIDDPQDVSIHLRVPYWAVDGVDVRVNGEALVQDASPGRYIRLARTWRDGDTIEYRMPMGLHVHRMPDDDEVMAFMYGPLVLVGRLGTERMPDVLSGYASIDEPIDVATLVVDSDDPEDWIQPVDGDAIAFRTVGQKQDVDLVPFYRLFGERYGIYWRVLRRGTARHQEYLRQQERHR